MSLQVYGRNLNCHCTMYIRTWNTAECSLFIHNKMKLTIRLILSAIKVFISSFRRDLAKTLALALKSRKKLQFPFYCERQCAESVAPLRFHPEGISIIIRNVSHQININKTILASASWPLNFSRSRRLAPKPKSVCNFLITRHNVKFCKHWVQSVTCFQSRRRYENVE